MNSETMRRNEKNCLALAQAAKDEQLRLKYLQMARAWHDLADNKDWLDGVLVSDHVTQPNLNRAA